MADNSSIAFEIYTTIIGKQNNLIKNNMIKEEDIIDITENDFIYKLQQTVNGLTSDISDANIVAAVYTNILKKVDKADSFYEVFSKEDMEISSDIVRESINEVRNSVVINSQEVKNPVEEAVVAGVAAGILLQGLNEAGDYESQLDYYNSLSEDKQKALSHAVYRETFGDEGALLMDDHDRKTEMLENDPDFSDVSQAVKEDARRTMDLYDPLKYIADELGFSIESVNDRAKRTILTNYINQYVNNKIKNLNMSEDQVSILITEIAKVTGLDENEVQNILENLEKKLKEDPDFLQNMTKLKERLDRNRDLIEGNLEEIRRRLTELSSDGHIPSNDEIYDLCLTAFDENGKLNYAVICANIKSNQNYMKSYSVENILDTVSKEHYASEDEIQNINNTGITLDQRTEIVSNAMKEVSMSDSGIDVKSPSNNTAYKMEESTTQTEPLSYEDNSSGEFEISMDDLTGGLQSGLMSFAGKKISFGPVTRQEPVTDQEYGPTYRSKAEEMLVDSKGLYKVQTDIKKINEQDGAGTGEGSDASTTGTTVVQNNDTLEVDTINTHQPATNSFINTARREGAEKDGKDLKGEKDGEGLEDVPPENDLPDNATPNNSTKNANIISVARNMRASTDDMQDIGSITITKMKEIEEKEKKKTEPNTQQQGAQQQGGLQQGDESTTTELGEIE